MTKQEYLEEFENFIKEKSNAGELYKSKAIVSQKSFWEKYTKILLDYYERDPKKYFANINSNKERKDSYKVKGHKGETTEGHPDNNQFQTEVRETMAMFNCQDKNAQFKLLDYQVPMKNSNKDREKNIDLVGTDGKSLYILEYKKFESEETLLRSVLECYTYRRLIDDGIGKFAENFGLRRGADVIPAILMMKGSKQYVSFTGQNKESPIVELMENLGVKAFVIEPSVDFKEDLEMKKLLAKEKPEFNFQFKIEEIGI